MSRRRKIILACVCAGLVVGLVGLRLGASRIVLARITSALRDEYGLEVESGRLSLALISGRARVVDVRITDERAPVLEADAIELSASFIDLLRGRYDFESLVVTRPTLHIVVEKGEKTNFARILHRRQQAAGPAHFVFFQDARIEDGRCLLDDAVTDPEHPVQLAFEEVDVALTEMQVSGARESAEPGDMRLDAFLMQKDDPARISFVGWAPALSNPLTIALHMAITGLDLAHIPQYVKKKTRSALGGDVIHLACTLRAEDNVIEDGALAATVAETKVDLSLRFGGTLSDIVFDEDSKLGALFHLPFARLGHMGDVAVTSTWKAAGDLGQGVVDAGEAVAEGARDTLEGMFRLDPLGALEAAGGGVLEGAKELGDGIVGVFRRLFGGSESPAKEAKKDKREQRRFTVLHEKCRHALLSAALESAKDSSSARRERIAAELAHVSAEEVPHPKGQEH